jgi:succinate dehydrogenase / fumarate reductase iron-sulfur subunit
MPFFVSDTPPPDRERLQGQAERARYDDTTKCLLGAACTTSCPSFWARSCRVGRAATVNAHVFIFASRDPAADELLELLADGDGIRRRRTTFSCVNACSRGINITRAILEVSRAVVERTV